MRLTRPAAALALAAGLAAVAAGTAGLALTRHPGSARSFPAAAVVAAPGGPIAAPPGPHPSRVARPATLTIPAIGVRTRLTRLGLTTSGALQVPPVTTVAGWYTGSPRPGEIGTAVIAGHVDSDYGPAVFFRLARLRPGDPVYIRRTDGTLAVFRVTSVRSYAKDHFPTRAVYGPTPDPELRLITCGGTFDPATGSYLRNIVVYATETG